jgi:hypothetical protein
MTAAVEWLRDGELLTRQAAFALGGWSVCSWAAMELFATGVKPHPRAFSLLLGGAVGAQLMLAGYIEAATGD